MVDKCGDTNRRLAVVLKAASVMVCCAGGLLYCWCTLASLHNDQREERFRADLEKELPNGTSWKQAENWLAANGFGERNGIYDDGREIGMTVTLADGWILEKAEIEVELYFDEKGRLQDRVVRRNLY